MNFKACVSKTVYNVLSTTSIVTIFTDVVYNTISPFIEFTDCLVTLR